jgi:hypothetical protein
MILISHRGNIYGPNKEKENEPNYIMDALSLGYDVEIDVWFENEKFWLGHDFPQYEVGFEFLVNEKIWCHGKNVEAIIEMKKYCIHYFWHETDKLTLTSKNYVWVYPGNQPIKNSIAVLPELFKEDISNCRGVCSDYIFDYKKK